MPPLRYALIRTSWGVAAAVFSSAGVRRVIWPAPSADGARRAVRRLAPEATPIPAARLPGGLARKLAEYSAGRRVDFSAVPLDLSGEPPFRARVLGVLRTVRYGRTTTYAALARRAGRAGGARAAGQAVARNPLPLIVPCHRVVRSDGSLGGFSAAGGVAVKRRLLAAEHAAGDRRSSR